MISDSAGNVVTSVPVTVNVRHAGCGCGAADGLDAGGMLLALAAARSLLGRKKARRQARPVG